MANADCRGIVYFACVLNPKTQHDKLIRDQAWYHFTSEIKVTLRKTIPDVSHGDRMTISHNSVTGTSIKQQVL